MRIHHLNCGSFCPLGGPAVCCHCLLLETANGLVLVDTGFGTADVRRPRPRLSRLMLRLDRVSLDLRDTAVEQVRELGFRSADVRHIVLTHLDFDHAGGLTDFPAATVHVMAEEAAAARHRAGFIARRRYRPAQWRGVAKWQEYRASGERWMGFDAVRQLEGLTDDILLVPLRGHSLGHAGVAVRNVAGWLLHAGDAYFDRIELSTDRPPPNPRVRAYEWLMQADGAARRANQARLRALAAGNAGEVDVVCSHDVEDLRLYRRRSERARDALNPSDRSV